MPTLDPNRLAFLQGVLAAFASSGEIVSYEEVRRLCRLNMELLGTYLGAAREEMLAGGQPDFCSVVVGRTKGHPGDGFFAAGYSDAATWAAALRDAHEFWVSAARTRSPGHDRRDAFCGG